MGPALLALARESFAVGHRSRAGLLAEMATAPPIDAGVWGTGRLGVWSGGVGAVLTSPARGGVAGAERSPTGRLDAAILAGALERLFGLDRDALTAGGRIGYTKDAEEALALVDRGEASAAFLLDPTPIEAVLAVAEAGEVMPQKSTYFHPKAPTGLVFNALEP